MALNPRADSLPFNDNNFRDIVANVLMSRQELMHKFFDPRRDYNKECGYPLTGEITTDKLREMYERDPIAARVVELFPRESWAVQPTIYEDEDAETVTKFEEEWDALQKTLRGQSFFKDESCSPIWEHLRRADELSGIGNYGVILLGIDDGKPLNQPVDGIGKDGKANGGSKTRELLFIRSFDEHLADITRYETDPSNARFGYPTEYNITLNDPRLQSQGGIGLSTATQSVHWHRVIHVADNLTSSEIFGTSRLRPTYNRIMDLMKLYGGSAEMYWRGAFPGLSIETVPQLGGDVEIDKTALREQMSSYMNGLQRYLALMGMSAKTLAPQVVDPTPQIKIHIGAICIKLGCPERVFMGSERGELASSQDGRAWNDRLMERQKGYLTPRLIIPFVDRLIAMRVLSKPAEGYSIDWPDLNATSVLEKADIGLKITQAVAAYVAGNVEALIPPMDYLTRVIGMEEEDAQAILDNAAEAERLTPDPEEQAQAQMDAQAEQFDKKIEADKEIKSQLAKKGIQPNEGFPPKKGGPPTANYSPTQPRDSEGQWSGGGSSGGGTVSGGRTKSEVAKQSAVRVDSEIQRYSEEHNEPMLAKSLRGKSLKDNEPVDVVVNIDGKAHGIELKTMTVGSNRKLTMKGSAMTRKKQWEKKNKGIAHTVVFDDSKVFNANGKGNHDFSKRRIFYRRGYGSFRVDGMHEIKSMKELKSLLGSKLNQLPAAAGGTKKG